MHCIRRRRSTSNRNVYIYSSKNIMYTCIKEKLVRMNAERRRNNNNDGADDVDPLADCLLHRYLPAASEYSSHYSYFIYARRVDRCRTRGGGGRWFHRAFSCLADVLYIHYTCIYHTTVALCVCVTSRTTSSILNRCEESRNETIYKQNDEKLK